MGRLAYGSLLHNFQLGYPAEAGQLIPLIEWKSHSMTKEVYTTLVFENKLVPAILQNWPSAANKCVLISQHDNATPHMTPDEFHVIWLEWNPEHQKAHGGGSPL
jgi:hypothetical protein